MLQAVVSDFLALPDLTVTTFLGAGVPNCLPRGPSLTTIPIWSEQDLLQTLRQTAAAVDAVLLVAPESGGILELLLRTVEHLHPCDRPRPSGTLPVLLNLDDQRTRWFTDKLATWQWLSAHGLPTIPTRLIDRGVAEILLRSQDGGRHGDSAQDSRGTPAVVIKPRDGAGSDGVRIVRDSRVRWQDLPDGAANAPLIAQPFVSGQACSFGLIGGDETEETTILPAAEQCLDCDGTSLQYRGGVVPAAPRVCEVVEKLARRMSSAVGGFRGYLGVDVIMDEALPEQVVIVEVNPRLCTSFVGYRALSSENLAARLLGLPSARHRPARWNSGKVSFDVSGGITPHSETLSATPGQGVRGSHGPTL